MLYLNPLCALRTPAPGEIACVDDVFCLPVWVFPSSTVAVKRKAHLPVANVRTRAVNCIVSIVEVKNLRENRAKGGFSWLALPPMARIYCTQIMIAIGGVLGFRE